jgi:outer membrane protein OmpA-like peptidoglycan-associated protein
VDAAFVLASDAAVLTAGDVGTGAEGSVDGARTLLSTTSANRVISEIYAVRADYLEANRDRMRDFVRVLFESEEAVREDVVKQVVDWEAVARHLLDDPQAVEEARGLWRNVETTGLQGNADWATDDRPRSFLAVNNEIQSQFVEMGLLSQAYALAMAGWDYGAFGEGLFDQRRTALPGFDDRAAADAVDELRNTDDLDENTLFEFEIRFQPNQTDFPPADYREEFDRVIELASTYGGAVLSVEGHSDPLRYLRRREENADARELRRIRQAARNLSLTRAMAVRDALLQAADRQDLSLDESQFVTAGLGILSPKTGLCGDDPCPPQTEAEWRSNMRVVFRVIQLEAEASVFTPINTW